MHFLFKRTTFACSLLHSNIVKQFLFKTILMPLPALNESTRFRYFTFFYLYAMQGIPAGFALTTLANYLVGQGAAPNIVGSFVAIIGTPWILQFMWGPVIDRYQFSVMGRRKHWLVSMQLGAFFTLLFLLLIKHPVQQVNTIAAIFFIHSIFASFQDTSVDATAIFVVPEQERGRVNAFMRGGFLIGTAVGAAILSTVLHYYNFFTAACLQSALLLTFTILTFFTKIDKKDKLLPAFGKKELLPDGHTPEEDNPSLKWMFTQLYQGIMAKKSLQIYGSIALVYLCFSVFIRSYTYHIIHVLHWQDNDVSVLQGSWGNLLTFVVVIFAGMIADKMGAARLQTVVLWALGIYFLALCGCYMYWGNRTLTTAGLIIWNFADPMFSVASFPLLMAMCRPKVEGSQFTGYMAFLNLCDVMGSYISGWALLLIPAPWLGMACGGIITALAINISSQQYRLRNSSLPNVPANN